MQQGLSRTKNVAKNIAWGYIANFAIIFFKFVSRTVFIHTLGEDYLGLNGLFSNVLEVLSFTELGIGNVLNYSLYKPLATNDTEKLKSLMALYKKAYRVIMFVVLSIGLLVIPLLPYTIKDAGNVEHIYLYYAFFLFNTVTSYMVSYKDGLMRAAQKGYAINIIDALVNIAIALGQSVVLIVFHNYLAYILIQVVFRLLQKVIMSLYVDKQFPLLKDKNVQKLAKDDKQVLTKNVEAMVYHKIGDVCVHQTDNIIVSTFISLSAVGKISNYAMITTYLSTIVATVINNCVDSIGNFMATESRDRKKEIFKVYNFMAFWLYGVAAIELSVLLQPFIRVWAGKRNIIDGFTVGLMVFEFYFTGLRMTVANYKTTCGIFQADKYIGVSQAVVNLVVSIVLVRLIGLPGVFIGTTAQGVIDLVWRPRIIYKLVFRESSKEYYITWLGYLGVIVFIMAVSAFATSRILVDVNLFRVIIAGIVVMFISNIVLYVIFRKTVEFQFIRKKVESLLRRRG